MAQSSNDVRDLVFLEDSVHNDGSIFKQWSMNLEFNIFANQHNRNYWCKEAMYEVYGALMYLSHDVAKVFNQDKKWIGYVALSTENAIGVDPTPKPMYFFKEEFTRTERLYKPLRLSPNEIHTFQFNDKEYVVDRKGDVKEVQANEFIDGIRVEEPVSEEKEEKSNGCFPSLSRFFKRNKNAGSSSFSPSSSSSTELEIEGYSSSRSSPSLSGFR